MRKIYISFLGTGNYSDAVYSLDGKEAKRTPYVQHAELLLLNTHFDKIYILGTASSKEKHWIPKESERKGLKERLEEDGILAEFIEISEDLNSDVQWKTFEQLLQVVQEGDHLTFDMTHGFRSVPIVFSSALHFLTMVRKVQLEHVFYGLFILNSTAPMPIYDYAGFYAIHDWTNAVARLIDEADARPLAEIVRKGSTLPIEGLNAPKLSQSLDRLTDAVRNIEIHNIDQKARDAIEIVRHTRQKASSIAAQLLLDLIEEKFSTLISVPPLSGVYERSYFELQLKIVKLLLDHQLYMQAFTVMREYIGSLGLIPFSYKYNEQYKNRKLADIFIRMNSYKKSTWKFSNKDELQAKDELLPWYEALEQAGIIDELKTFINKLTSIRNGLDHAWTKEPKMQKKIPQKGFKFHQKLQKLTEDLFSSPQLQEFIASKNSQ